MKQPRGKRRYLTAAILALTIVAAWSLGLWWLWHANIKAEQPLQSRLESE